MSEVDAVFDDLLEDAAIDPVRELLKDEDTAHLYLMERWLTDAVAKLRDARREAGLTQEEVAERLGTKQPAIARLERDHEGRFSLRRFVEHALACGALPLDIVLKSSENAREYALENPDEPTTETAYESWITAPIAQAAAPEEHELYGAIGSWHSGRISLDQWDVFDCFYGEIDRGINIPVPSYGDFAAYRNALVHAGHVWEGASTRDVSERPGAFSCKKRYQNLSRNCFTSRPKKELEGQGFKVVS